MTMPALPTNNYERGASMRGGMSAGRVRAARWALSMVAFLLAALSVVAPSAQAAFGIAPGGFTMKLQQADGSVATQAASHPYGMATDFHFNMMPQPQQPSAWVDGSVKDLRFKLPIGLSGDPEATAKCTRESLAIIAARGSGDLCPDDSQIGIARIRYAYAPDYPEVRPVFNLVPAPGKLAQFGIPVATVAITITAGVDTAGDFAVTASSLSSPQTVPVEGVTVTLWGVPNDPSHDLERTCGTPINFGGEPPCPVSAKRKPFLTMPSQCSNPLTALMSANSWQDPVTTSFASYEAPAVTGCDKLEFAPAIAVTADGQRGGAPTGLGVDLTLPQEDDTETGLGAPPMRDVKVTLPEGMTINPGSADGLEACTDSQLGLKTDNPVTCPEAAKIGTVRADTPVLTEPLVGEAYLRTQASDDPESGDMFRLAFVLANPERGLLVKLAGSVKVNKSTGQIMTAFVDNPQLPVSKIALKLKTGPRAPLVRPASCDGGPVRTNLSSWAGHSVDLNTPLAGSCTPAAGGFAPTLTAGSTNPVGGAFSPFAVKIDKPDGNVDINGLSMVLPTGLLASLKGNIGAQVGTVKAYAGSGTNPYMLPGKAFLEGAYGDAPFSVRAVVPAKAGPFDLGDVTVRQKIYVDPITGQVTVVSDPLPTIVKGVPVRLQRLEVDVDKPGFIINPTSCAAKSIGGTLGAVDGRSAPIDVRFQVGDCASLDLKPQLALSLSGKGQTTDGKHPAIAASLVQKPGQSNLKRVRVALPLSLALDVDNANGLCEFVDGSKVTPTCPKSSIVGSATAVTPILDEPLSGPVYFVKNVRKDPKSGRSIKTLPKLVIPLVGQNGVKLTLTGTSDVEDEQLVTTFDNIPDAPVSSFKLNISGGKGGILAVSGDKVDICKSTQIAEQQVDGQNNKSADTDVYIQTPSCPTKILSKTITKKTVKLKIGGLGAGKVTVTGRGIRKTTKSIAKSTVVTITAKRTKGKPGAFKVKFTKAKAAVA